MILRTLMNVNSLVYIYLGNRDMDIRGGGDKFEEVT